MAQSIHANGVRFYENGVVSLNLPVAQEALRSRASRTTHPLALHLLSSLCAAILEADFAVDNPFLFKTKTEVVGSLAMHQAAQLIGSTCSCSHSMFQTKTQRHCGRCSQCIDRRFATLAAELQSFDSSKDYVSDVFSGPRNDPLEKAIAIDYVRHGLELAQKSENEIAAAFNTELSRAVRHVEARSQAAREIISMHKRVFSLFLFGQEQHQFFREGFEGKPPPLRVPQQGLGLKETGCLPLSRWPLPVPRSENGHCQTDVFASRPWRAETWDRGSLRRTRRHFREFAVSTHD